MADLRQRTLVSVRANLDRQNGNTNVFARSRRAEFVKPFCFDRAEQSITGAGRMLGRLVDDVLGLLASNANAKRLTIAAVEAEPAEPLQYLGVLPRWRFTWKESNCEPS